MPAYRSSPMRNGDRGGIGSLSPLHSKDFPDEKRTEKRSRKKKKKEIGYSIDSEEGGSRKTEDEE